MNAALHILAVADADDCVTSALRGFEGAAVDSTTDAFDACRMLTRKAYRVITLDVSRLDEDSLRFLRVAREEAPDAMVIAVVADADREKGLRALRQGADLLLRKPFYPDELRLAVRRWQRDRPTASGSSGPGEARAATLARMAKGVAHRINNPLASISGWLQVLAESSHLPERDRTTVDLIQDEARKIGAAVDWLLLLSGQQIPVPEPVRVNELVCSVVNELEERTSNARTRMALRLSPDTPMVLGDPAQLRRAVAGILDRFVSSCTNGAVIRVETARADRAATLAFHAPPGTAPKLQDTSPDGPLPDENEGGGFDLIICRRVVENHGGTVEVSDDPGTTVRITLPAAGPGESR